MTEYLAAMFLLFTIAGIAVLLERNHRKTGDLPRAPFGVDLEADADLARLRHDLDVARRTAARDPRHSRRHHTRAA